MSQRSSVSPRLTVTSLVLLTMALMGARPQPLHAWGATAHRVTAAIAESRLSPEARAQVRALLASGGLVEASTWADEVRGLEPYDWIRPLHFVNLDPEVGRFERCPPQGCLVDAINRALDELRDPEASQSDRRLWLRLLVHFVGDLHQPLHVSHFEDRGGNRIGVDFFGEPWNLHSVWDTGIINRRRGSWRRLAKQLGRQITDSEEVSWPRGTLLDWVHESYRHATERVYPSAEPGQRLGRRYVEEHAEFVELRLKQAGVRIAALLNSVFEE